MLVLKAVVAFQLLLLAGLVIIHARAVRALSRADTAARFAKKCQAEAVAELECKLSRAEREAERCMNGWRKAEDQNAARKIIMDQARLTLDGRVLQPVWKLDGQPIDRQAALELIRINPGWVDNGRLIYEP